MIVYTTYGKVGATAWLPFWLIRIVDERTALSIQYEPTPRPGMKRGAQLVQIAIDIIYIIIHRWYCKGRLNSPATTVRIDKHVWTEINLMSSGLDMMSQIQIGREYGQVACQGTLMLWQGTFAFPIAATAGSAAAASASAAAAASTAHAARRCRVLRVAVAAGAFVVRLLLLLQQQFVAVGQLGCLNGSIAVVGLRQWPRTTRRCTDCMMLQFWLRMALLREEKRRGEHTLEVG